MIYVGYDIVEYHPYLGHRNPEQKIVHIDALAADVDEHYILEVGVVGDIGASLGERAVGIPPRSENWAEPLRREIHRETGRHAEDAGSPVKPQKILWDLRQVLAPRELGRDDAMCETLLHRNGEIQHEPSNH